MDRTGHRQSAPTALVLWIALAFLIVPTSALSAQANRRVSLDVTPGAIIPWGDSGDLYEFGYGAGLTGRLLLGESPIFLGGGLAFGMVPTQATAALTLFDGGVGPGVLLQPGESAAVDLELGTRAGGYVSLYEGAGAGNPHATAYGAIRFRISAALNLGVGTNYGYYANFDDDGDLTDPFFQGVGAYLSVRWTPGAAGSGPAEPDLEIGPPNFQRVFPVFYRYYDENPLGSVSLKNEDRRAIEEVEVSFFAPRYMEAPKVVAQFDALDRDEEMEVPLLALFNDGILGVTESTSVQARIIVSYDYDGTRFTTERAETLEVQNRNQMTWDDDRKAAAFVTAGDPTVQRMSRNVTSLTRSIGNVAVNERLRNAMAIHETLNLYGIEYVIDPDSSYIELSQNENAMDYLQFPVQTL
ncbi:MAG TPA: hypothetical protein VJ932_11370, partial [Alkalispirochaeta sp.]|nr:hypothetical protein [Alkalispirochaeta sp.]